MSNGIRLLEYEDELLAALEEAKTVEVDGLRDEQHTITAPEARKALNISREKTTALLDDLCKSGKLRRDMVERVSGWGHLKRVAGYRLVSE